MATNRGRVIGGYMDANGNIVEEYANPAQEMYDFIHGNETEFNPSWRGDITPTVNPIQSVTPSNTFSNYDVYNLQAQGYANQGDNAMANAYGGIANNLGRYSSFANNSLNAADALLNYVKQNETGLQGAARGAYNTILSDLQNQRDYINSTFGPEGSLTREVNSYYDDLGNYLATDAGRQAATIAAQGVHSGASLGSIRAQQNEAYNQSFQRYVQAKEQQINAKQQIASNLINFMSTLRKEYGDTTNQYIIELYKRANDLYNNVALSAAQDLESYNKLRLSASGGSGGNGSTLNDILKSIGLVDENGNPTTDATEVIKSQGDTSTSNETTTSQDTSKLGTGSRSAGGNSSNVNWVNVFNAMLNPVGFWGTELGKGIGGLIK